MALSPDRRRGKNQSPLTAALRPHQVASSPLSFSRSAPATSLSTPYAKRRCISTGSIPSADDPFSNASSLSSDDERVTRVAAISYPALPSFQSHRNEGSPSSSHANTPNNAIGSVTTPSRPPRMRNRTVSDTAQLRSPPRAPRDWTMSQVDAEVEHWIRNRLSETERNETGVGNNYLFEATLSGKTTTPGVSVVKIGYTTKRPRLRASRIQYECGDHEMPNGHSSTTSIGGEEGEHPSPNRFQDEPTSPVRLFKRVEKLAHAQLTRHCHVFTCSSCGKKHHEYFAVDVNLAHTIQATWRDFVSQEPYNVEGHLTPFWEARLRAFVLNRAYPQVINPVDSESATRTQSQHWNSFANPYFLDFVWYDLLKVTSRLWTRKWQTLTLLQAFVIACLAFPNFLAFMCFAGLALGILLEACFYSEIGFGNGGEKLYSISGLMNGTRRAVSLLRR